MRWFFLVLFVWTLIEIDVPMAEAAAIRGRRQCIGGQCQQVRQGGCIGGKCGIRRPIIRR